MESIDERDDSAGQFLSGPQLVNPRDRTDLECCEKCQKMTGTLKGLQALLHEDGYGHSDRQELEISKAQGCLLVCVFCISPIGSGIMIELRAMTHIGRRIPGTRRFDSVPILLVISVTRRLELLNIHLSGSY
jgi:hypothetical protein